MLNAAASTADQNPRLLTAGEMIVAVRLPRSCRPSNRAGCARRVQDTPSIGAQRQHGWTASRL